MPPELEGGAHSIGFSRLLVNDRRGSCIFDRDSRAVEDDYLAVVGSSRDAAAHDLIECRPYIGTGDSQDARNFQCQGNAR